MADKRSSDQAGTIPKKPPKRPTRDYSALPQRPITLKQSGKKKLAGKRPDGGVDSKPPSNPVKKASAKKTARQVKRQPTDEWLLKGIAQSTRDYARQEAEAQGLTLEAWLEQLILSQQQPLIDELTDESDEDYLMIDLEQIVDTLSAIEARLERIEDQRGFWSKLWEQAMKQSKS